MQCLNRHSERGGKPPCFSGPYKIGNVAGELKIIKTFILKPNIKPKTKQTDLLRIYIFFQFYQLYFGLISGENVILKNFFSYTSPPPTQHLLISFNQIRNPLLYKLCFPIIKYEYDFIFTSAGGGAFTDRQKAINIMKASPIEFSLLPPLPLNWFVHDTQQISLSQQRD